MRSFDLITKEEFIEKYSKHHNKYIELNTVFGRRGLNLISEVKIKNNHEIVEIMNELDQIFGFDELYSENRVVNCVVSE
ncbi:hypothetical protein [Macrococcus animalis]|uniref:hypothetical protein n=1 Tax=Macrococcus animalis TaxID=3395467 RepID=UPI0039BE00FB